MNIGVITYYNEERGFGFVKDIIGENFFFHFRDFAAGVSPCRLMKVKFESKPASKGGKCDRAIKIEPDETR